MTEVTDPVTFTEARDELSPHEALTRLAEHGTKRFQAMRSGDVVAHLEEIALMSAVAHWWGERWRPGSMHGALMYGASVDQVAAARGADAATVAAEWREWAAGQRRLYADMEARGDRPIGITADEYARVAGILGLDTADPAVTVQLPKQITGELRDVVAPKHMVTLDVTDADAYFALTAALEEWAHHQRDDAEYELAADPEDTTATKRLRWAETADALLVRIVEA